MELKQTSVKLPQAVVDIIKQHQKENGLASFGASITSLVSIATGTDFTHPTWGGLRARLDGPHISVANGRAMVCKLVVNQSIPADNWEELEDRAIEAVEVQGGFINLSGVYGCPAELGRQGVWHE